MLEVQNFDFFFAETEGTPYICNLHIIWHLLILMTSLKNSLIFFFILNHSLYWFKNLFGEDFFFWGGGH